MSINDDYARARANVDRLMQLVGKSIDAYEDVDVRPEPLPAGAIEVVTSEGTELMDPATYQSIMVGIADLDREARRKSPEPETSEWTEHEPVDPVVRCPHCHGEVRYSSLLGDNEGFPISSEYCSRGLVEGAGELESLWAGFTEAIRTGQPGTVRLDTGEYEMAGTRETGFTLLDPAKGYLYVMETGRYAELADVDPEAVFVWVLRESDPEGDALGYILNGWVFARRGILPG